MAQTNRDGERRASILRLTLDGLEADLDDLRDELIDDLERYEGDLRDASESLPEWLAVEPAAVRSLFQLPTDGERPAGVLGPRTVALAAASVEGFISSWMASAPDELDEEGAHTYEAAYASTVAEIEGYETFARHAARDAQETLAEWLDAILMELEDTRERDEAALRQLISEGTIEKGRNAREEIAELWEEQRARAADVRRRWAELEEHTFRGLEKTVDGLAELHSMMERADSGVRGAYDALDELSEPSEPAEDLDAPGGGTLAGMQHDSEADEVYTVRRETMEIDRHEDIDEAPNTFLRVSPSDEDSRAEDDIDDDIDHDIDEAGDTLVDDVGDTTPIDTSELQQLAEDSAAEHESAEVETVEMDRTPDHEPEEPEGTEEEADEPVDEPEVDEEPSSPGVAEDHADDSTELASGLEPVLTDGFRILDRYRRVSLVESLLVLGPPIGAFIFLIVQTASARAGSGVDPIRDTPWGLVVFAAAVVWLFLAPLIAHWQFRFDGIVPRFVRRGEVVEEAEVEVDERGLRIGEQKLTWKRSRVSPSRWESAPDGTFGWSVEVSNGKARIVLAAAERNFSEWERSDLPVDDDIEHDVWQVDARVVRAVSELSERR